MRWAINQITLNGGSRRPPVDLARDLAALRAAGWTVLEAWLPHWDGASIHRGQPIKDFLAAGAAHRLRLEVLPGYAPDLNPLDQGVWQHLKHVELANVCCTDLRHLRRELRGAVNRLRRKPRIIRGCIRHAGYEL